MRVPDSSTALPLPRTAEQRQSASAGANDAFWQDLLKAATAIESGDSADHAMSQGEGGNGDHAGHSDRASVPQGSSRPDRQVVPQAIFSDSSVTASVAAMAIKASEAPEVPNSTWVGQTPAMGEQAVALTDDPRQAATGPRTASAHGTVAMPQSDGAPTAQEVPWQATFMIDAHGQRKLFLRSAQLSSAQALALAAELARQDDGGQGAALGAIHLNGQPIYRQSGSGASDTLLIC